MKDFIISTETNSDLSQEFLTQNDVLVIPHYYTVEEDEYGDGKELTIKQFYDEMRAGKKVGTMASNPAVILERFTEIAKQGKDILHISFSSALSCGYQNICNGANEVMEEYPDCNIIVIDTLSASLGEGIMIRKALEMKAEGKTMEEAAQQVREMIDHMSVHFTVDNLDYLYRGGRLSKTSAVLGTMINLKPVLHVNEEGKLVAIDKVRGRKKSMNTLIENMEQKIGSYKDKQEIIGIIHGDCDEDAGKLEDQIKEKLGYENFLIEPIGPSIGAHTGPGTLGIVFMADHK